MIELDSVLWLLVLLSRYDRTRLYVIAFSFCFLIVMNFTASNVFS